MVDTFASHPKVGMVVPLLLQANGKILSAGGIVFSDGSGWEYGRGEDLLGGGDGRNNNNNKNSKNNGPPAWAARPELSYVRRTDYGSAYC